MLSGSSQAMSMASQNLIYRSKFLSASAASFTAAVMGSNLEACDALGASVGKDNPRYLDGELEMKYADDKSKRPFLISDQLICVMM
jgi:hypothetical protein